jgi:hypothetical protein
MGSLHSITEIVVIEMGKAKMATRTFLRNKTNNID